MIGYGGGIADPATTLVRIGARDYDTATGRWTAPDPLGIAGGSANLYTYRQRGPGQPHRPARHLRLRRDRDLRRRRPRADRRRRRRRASPGRADSSAPTRRSAAAAGSSATSAIGVTVTCLDSDNGDTSLGNFSGTGCFGERSPSGRSAAASTPATTPPATSPATAATGRSASAGASAGRSRDRSPRSSACSAARPRPVTVCGDLGCSSSPGKSASDPSTRIVRRHSDVGAAQHR